MWKRAHSFGFTRNKWTLIEMIVDYTLMKFGIKATYYLLLAVFAATLATLPVPVLFSLQATDYGDIPLGSCKAHTHYWGERCGAPAFLILSPCLTGPVD
jgi:hypothetical protein